MCLWAVPALSNEDADTLTKAGIAGTTWAIDCANPPSKTNYYLFYGISPSGIPNETQTTIPGAEKVRELRNVQIISDEWLLYTLIDTDQEPVNILTKYSGNRHKSWWSVGKEGKSYIRDGKLIGEGAPPWFEKCK
jgi:hypothetical protein